MKLKQWIIMYFSSVLFHQKLFIIFQQVHWVYIQLEFNSAAGIFSHHLWMVCYYSMKISLVSPSSRCSSFSRFVFPSSEPARSLSEPNVLLQLSVPEKMQPDNE